MKLKSLFVLSVLPITVFAAQKFPSQCRVSGLKYTHDDIALFSQHTANPRLYVLENTGKHPIWLNHDDNKGGVGAGWASQLFPQHWSALLVTKHNFDLTCHWQNKAGHMEKLPCHSIVRVCQFSEFDSKNPVGGGYWVTENVPYHALESRIRARGFSLPVKKSIER